MSKALNINARTITLFHKSNIQQQILKQAHRLNKFTVYQSHKPVKTVDVSSVLQSKTPFSSMYVLPQTISERIIQQQLQSTYKLKLKRGHQAIDIKNINNKVQVTIKTAQKTIIQVYDMVLAADGAHSLTRKSMGLKFEGQTLKQKLYLTDILLSESSISQIQAHLTNKGRCLLIPMSKNTARVVSNSKAHLDIIKKKHKVQSIIWQNQFIINNRIIEKMRVGNVYFAGDAAHVHAPIGGRGMNMGIEDVFVFASLLDHKRLDEYQSLRLAQIKVFINRVRQISRRALQNEGILGRLLLPMLLQMLGGRMMNEMIIFGSGLDHDVPYLPRL